MSESAASTGSVTIDVEQLERAVIIPNSRVAIGTEISRGAEGIVCKATYSGQDVCAKVLQPRGRPPRLFVTVAVLLFVAEAGGAGLGGARRGTRAEPAPLCVRSAPTC